MVIPSIRGKDTEVELYIPTYLLGGDQCIGKGIDLGRVAVDRCAAYCTIGHAAHNREL